MYSQVLNLENAKKDMFRDNQRTKNVPVMFFDVTVLMERDQLYCWALSTDKEDKVFLFKRLKNLK